jgi:hypothetical protein
MNSRWTLEEERKLLKLIASGKTCKELCGGFNRSENALELRLKKIIYDNINNKKPIDKISELLHMNKDIIMQHYYSYKDYVEKQQQRGGNISDNIINDTHISETKINKLNNINLSQNQMIGGNKLQKLEEQNKKMKLILENYMLKHKITKLLKNKDNGLYKDALNALIE